jgi:hypothetical protein
MSLKDLSRIAEFLLANPHPAEWAWCRSVANRAYYGALHQIMGHLKLPSWSRHEVVPRWIRDHKPKPAPILMRWRTLQAMRIYADYFERPEDFILANLQEGNFCLWFSGNTTAVNSAIRVSAKEFARGAYALAQECIKSILQ